MISTPGWTELVVILVIVMIIFGVGKLPDVGKGLGKGIREFKDAYKPDQIADGKAKEEKQKEEKAE